MRLIIKHKGENIVVLYDRCDDKLIKSYTWHYDNGYAKTNLKTKNGFRHILMHRLIMGVIDEKDIFIDHKNHDKLNNKRNNLRRCTKQQNCRNRKARGESKYLGVSLIKRRYKNKVYRYPIATIRVDGRIKYLGTFGNEKLAAMAYDSAVKKYYGTEFSTINFK